MDGGDAEIKVNNENLLLIVQVDGESWHSASDPVEEGVDSKDFQKRGLTVLEDFFGCEGERRVLTDFVFQPGCLSR